MAILHDSNLAAAFANQLILRCARELRADGTLARILTPEFIQDDWGVDARVEGSGPVVVSSAVGAATLKSKDRSAEQNKFAYRIQSN